MLRPYRKGMRWRRHDSPDSPTFARCNESGTGGRRQFIPKAARLGSRAAFDLASRSAQRNTKV